MTRKGILGGTFDVIHDGHKALLLTAFEEADHVFIGVTSDKIANASRNRIVTKFERRVEELRDVCKTYENIYDTSFEITKIQDSKSNAVEIDADFIVLAPEQKTHERAAEINLERVKKGKDRLQIIESPLVSDYKDRKISSTRIIKGNIDTHGDKL